MHKNNIIKKLTVTSLVTSVILSVICLVLLSRGVDSKSQVPTSITPISKYEHPLVPVVSKSAVEPFLNATSFILVDVTTNQILVSGRPNERIYPASITKLATALTALNIFPLDESITIGETYQNGKIMKLETGEKITVKSLVTALLVYSANDAAFNLASHHQEGVTGFVKEMNLIAAKYNLKNTHFTNFDGIHSKTAFLQELGVPAA